ncbi:hypothetical protein RZS08_19880, partial [Arthrospira platensis SPKY1]|nr:hypothetical protein [Arthrospira platensis SPKY1]
MTRPSAPSVASHPPAREGEVHFEEVISGVFDEAQAASEPQVPKRVLTPQVDSPKLHKVLAQAGLGSRLEMEQMILEGR